MLADLWKLSQLRFMFFGACRHDNCCLHHWIFWSAKVSAPERVAWHPIFSRKRRAGCRTFLSHAMRVGRKVFIELNLSQFNIWSVPQTNWHGTWKCFFTNQLLLGSMLIFVGVVSWSYYSVHRGRSGKNDVSIRLARPSPRRKNSHLTMILM